MHPVIVFLACALLSTATARPEEAQPKIEYFTVEEVASWPKEVSTGGNNTIEAEMSIPVELAAGNWGDLVLGRRRQGDRLLRRDVVILDREVCRQDLNIIYSVRLSARITSVRSLNLGLQRAFTTRIEAGGVTRVTLLVRAGVDPRVLLEIYGN